jgi:hypothetical protein
MSQFGHLKVLDLFDTGRMRVMKGRWDTLGTVEKEQYADRNWVTLFRKQNCVNGLTQAIAGQGAAVQERVLGALMTALICLAQHSENKDLWKDPKVNVPLLEFRGMTPHEQAAIIDKIWASMVTSVIPTTPSETMTEPSPAEAGLPGKAFHSATVPDGKRGYVKLKEAPALPFHEYAIGFRTEGKVGDATDFDRLTQRGFTSVYQDAALAMRLKGHVVENTRMCDPTSVKLFLDNMDVCGETGVCAARCLFGAAAFPMRETVGDYYLWAFRLKGLNGYDTEAFQKERLWRPGEKVYTAVPPQRILGRVPIKKKGTSLTIRGTKRTHDGWHFEIPHGTEWTWHNATPKEKYYLTLLLQNWWGDHQIPGDMDFAD